MLQCPNAQELIDQYYPSFFIGYDKLQRPCNWKCFGNVAVHKLLEHTTEEGLFHYHLHAQEKSMQRMAERSAETGLNVERMSVSLHGQGVTHV